MTWVGNKEIIKLSIVLILQILEYLIALTQSGGRFFAANILLLQFF